MPTTLLLQFGGYLGRLCLHPPAHTQDVFKGCLYNGSLQLMHCSSQDTQLLSRIHSWQHALTSSLTGLLQRSIAGYISSFHTQNSSASTHLHTLEQSVTSLLWPSMCIVTYVTSQLRSMSVSNGDQQEDKRAEKSITKVSFLTIIIRFSQSMKAIMVQSEFL